MKTVVFFLLFPLFSPVTLYAQSGWFPLNSGTSEVLWSSFFTDENTGYVGGSNSTLLKTVNGGNNWSSNQLSPSYTLRSIYFTDLNTGFIAGGGNSGNNGTIFRTINGGINWSEVILPFNRNLYSIFFINSNTGYAGGYHIIFKTTDAGLTWTDQTVPTEVDWIFTVYIRDASTGYATGGTGGGTGTGYLLKTTNGGNNWQTMYTYTGAGLGSVSFADANTGVAVAGGSNQSLGGIIRTTNGGNNWTNLNYSSGIINLWSIRFITSTTGYITGASPSSGLILKTTNAGINWCSYGFISNFLFSSYFTNINTGYTTGFTGMILKTTDGGGNCFLGINPVSHHTPSSFELYQNYPNPFNPVTKIRFQAPLSEGKTQVVSLTIYDVLAREVATLVNEQLKPGTYEVEWDASNYPSGVYYYTLQAGEYKETKKMILIK